MVSSSTVNLSLVLLPPLPRVKRTATHTLLLILMVILVLWWVPGRAWGDYETLAVPGADATYARGINNFGVVVGSANFTPNGSNGNGTEGFTWTAAGGYSLFNISGAYSISPYGINDSGQIVGIYGLAGPGGGAFLLNPGGSVTTLSVPGATSTEASGINNAGFIVGSFSNSSGEHGFLRDPSGTYTVLDAPDGLGSTYAFGINNLGQIVGESSAGAFLRDASGIYTNIDLPGTANTAPEGINDSGQITGVYLSNGPANSYPFVRNSDGTFVTPNIPGANVAYGINDSGQIVGTYQEGETLYGYVNTPLSVTSTPAPSSWILAISGAIVGLLFACYCRLRGFRYTFTG